MPPRDEPKTSRRSLLHWAALGVPFAAACDFRRHTSAVPGIDGATADDAGTNDASTDADDGAIAASDTSGLNELLALEYTLVAAYDALAPALQSPAASDPLAPAAAPLLAIALRWRQHHLDYAAALSAAITATGGTPVSQASVTYTLPDEYQPIVESVLKVACNAEKSAAIAQTHHVAQFAYAPHRYLAGSIAGGETQHFIALYALLRGSAQPGPALAAMVSQVVPKAFVSDVVGGDGLQSVPDLAFE